MPLTASANAETRAATSWAGFVIAAAAKAFAAKREIPRVANRVLAPVPRREQRLRGMRVHRHLQRRVAIGRAAELVVDDAQRAVLEHINAVGLGANLDLARLEPRLSAETRSVPSSVASTRRSATSSPPVSSRSKTPAAPGPASRATRAAAPLPARDRPAGSRDSARGRAARRARRRRRASRA